MHNFKLSARLLKLCERLLHTLVQLCDDPGQSGWLVILRTCQLVTGCTTKNQHPCAFSRTLPWTQQQTLWAQRATPVDAWCYGAGQHFLSHQCSAASAGCAGFTHAAHHSNATMPVSLTCRQRCRAPGLSHSQSRCSEGTSKPHAPALCPQWHPHNGTARPTPHANPNLNHPAAAGTRMCLSHDGHCSLAAQGWDNTRLHQGHGLIIKPHARRDTHGQGMAAPCVPWRRCRKWASHSHQPQRHLKLQGHPPQTAG